MINCCKTVGDKSQPSLTGFCHFNNPAGLRNMKSVIAFFVLCAIQIHFSSGLDNGLGRLPQMGWNSWNHYGCNVNETVIIETIDAMASNGLRDAGYIYVNIDDCWQTSRLANGTIVADPATFPSGIPYLSNYAHSKGMLFGLYSDAGYQTCAGRPGSLGYETIDANTYAYWNVDYLKYDNCNTDGTPPETRYPVMGDALNATGVPIFYSMCEWGVNDPATWATNISNSWRTTGDISDDWESMISRAQLNDRWWKFAAPGGWNDPDMLEVGNGGMTNTEYITHFSLWALMKAPLLVGCDVTTLDSSNINYQILTNKEVIAVNQDASPVQGHKVASDTVDTEVWAGPLSDGSVAVILLNMSKLSQTITAEWSDIGLSPQTQATVRDLWQHSNVGTFSGSYSAKVASHGVVMVRITPVTH